MKTTTFLFTLCSFIFTAHVAHAQSNTQQVGGYPNATIQDYQAPAQNKINWLTDYNAAVSQSRATSKPILILFTGTGWCPACIKLERQVLTAAPFIQSLSQRLIFVKAEFPSYTSQSIQASPFNSLLERYHVDAFPTMVVINADGYPLFTVDYQAGGVEAYVKEIAAKLDQNRR